MSLPDTPTKEMQSARIICVIGGPCVGKGTHCKSLAKELDLIHVSVGDILRAEAQASNAEDEEVIIGAMKAGKLAPNERVQTVLGNHLLGKIRQGKTHFLVDGFPRSIEQATAFRSRGWKTLGTLHFDASDEVLRARMRKRAEREGRVDDTVEIHEKRMREFEKESPDVISFLKGEGDYKKVDCEPDFDVVYKGLPGLVKSIFIPGFEG